MLHPWFDIVIDPVSGPLEGGTVVTISGSNLGQRPEDVQDSVSVAGVPCHVIPSRYEDPVLTSVSPLRGPKAGGSRLRIGGRRLRTGHAAEVSVSVGGVPCLVLSIEEDQIVCVSGSSNRTGEHGVAVRFGGAERYLQGTSYHYTPNPNITRAAPSKSFLRGGRTIRVTGHNLDVVQEPRLRVTLSPPDPLPPRRRRRRRRRSTVGRYGGGGGGGGGPGAWSRPRRIHESLCTVLSSSALQCRTPAGVNLDLAISKEEVVALIGDGVCTVKTLTHHHLYCEPPAQQPPRPVRRGEEGLNHLPEFTVQMGNLAFSLGRVQYDTQGPGSFPLEAQVGVGVGASLVGLMVLIIVFVYRRKSKQAMRDYKKVQIQLENLETSLPPQWRLLVAGEEDALGVVTLFNCSVGRSDCSRCRTAEPRYGCVWCGSPPSATSTSASASAASATATSTAASAAAASSCVYGASCAQQEVTHTCPAPAIHFVRAFIIIIIIIIIEDEEEEELMLPY
ncbi:hypothetical protein CRUP_025248 [Coryphaenoides rupestris]|nr:hypothetical protein CRUP_025248 [Coryphaenoides rupestris]